MNTHIHPVTLTSLDRALKLKPVCFWKMGEATFPNQKEMKAEGVQMNVGIRKRKYCTHYSHQSCAGNMNSSNYMNISHLFQQIPP